MVVVTGGRKREGDKTRRVEGGGLEVTYVSGSEIEQSYRICEKECRRRGGKIWENRGL